MLNRLVATIPGSKGGLTWLVILCQDVAGLHLSGNGNARKPE
jgi:hypothetical protein